MNVDDGAPQGASLAKLDELIRRTEEYARGNASRSTAAAATATDASQHGRQHGMKTEEEEDQDMVQDEIDEESAAQWPTHFTSQPSCIEGGTMRPYQIEALNWIIGLHDSGLNGILADEMGLGKTLQSISVLGYLKQYRGVTDPHIIVVPKSTLGNWCREVNKWCPSLHALRFHGSKDERVNLREQLKERQFDVLLTTYEMAVMEKGPLSKINWHFMYIDEAHRIKNECSLLAQVVRTYPTKHRLLITGTPLQNNLHELWALLNFLLPHLFDSSDDFNDWFSVIENADSEGIVQRLHRVLRPFLLRRLKLDVERSLLPKVETILHVGMTALQREWYTSLLTRNIDALNSASGSKVRFLNLLMQLRKTCNHPYLFQGAEPGPPFEEGRHLIDNAGKMVLLDKLLVRLYARGSRVLIFSQMTRMLDIIEDYMRLKSFKYCRIDGQTNSETRENEMDDFNAPSSTKFAFLLSTRAGGLGINLQTADTVILYDSDWNPQMDLQAQDRAHRIGQTKQVHVYRLVTEGTVEEKIVERAYKKLFLDAVVIQQGRLSSQSNKLGSQELNEIVRFGADQIFRSKESTVTDEDIDAIMRRGEESTKAMTASLQTNTAFNLANFSLAENKGDASIYNFDGQNFKDQRLSNTPGGSSFQFLSIPKRDRKQNYDVDDYYRSQMKNTAKSRASVKDRAFKPSTRYDFQFFDIPRLHELEEIQFDGKKCLQISVQEWKERERVEKIIAKEKEREAKEKAAALASDGPAGDSPSEDTELTSASVVNAKADITDSPCTPRQSAKSVSTIVNSSAHDSSIPPKSDREAYMKYLEQQAGGLTVAQKNELEKLEAAGFGDWKVRDFTNFIRGSELYGRDQLDAITEVVQTKSLAEVRAYHARFWSEYKKIKDWKRLLAQIEKGETKLERQEQINLIIRDKIAMYKDPLSEMEFNYPAKSTSVMKGYIEDEDRFLFHAAHEVGYGNWDELKVSIRQSWMFRFDWFIKSRSSIEIGKRVDFLISLAESELAELAKKRQATSKKRKSIAKPSVTKTKPSASKSRASTNTRKGAVAAGKKASLTKKQPSAKKTRR